jgi:transglutaminase-like putative cysteine protease
MRWRFQNCAAPGAQSAELAPRLRRLAAPAHWPLSALKHRAARHAYHFQTGADHWPGRHMSSNLVTALPRAMGLALAAALLACALASGAHAQDTGTDPSLIIEKYIRTYVVNPDGSFVVTVDNVQTIVEARAIDAHSQFHISYNQTLDDVLSIEAYTLKPDGRSIPVQAAQILDQQETAAADAPMFQDARVKIVTFPDVAVADRLVLRYVLKRKTPLFPGQFEDLSSSQFYLNKQFQLIYDMPASMPLYFDGVGFKSIPLASAPGRRRYRWDYVPGQNERIEADSVSYLDYGKRLAVSTFADYGAFARVYQTQTQTQTQAQARTGDPTPSMAPVRALAKNLTQALADPRAKAFALSDWVRRNIRYVGVAIGPGGVAPHPAATVLANRYGDCKDHVSLLEGLLAAAGIDSTGALINGTNAYRLPGAPTLGIFNHAITYIPSLNLYLDSSARSIGAGYLPKQNLGKPVLLLKSGKLSQTPSTQLESNRNAVKFEVQENGASKFTATKLAAGAVAEAYRQAIRATAPAERAMLVERMLAGIKQKGAGELDAGELGGNGDRYRMTFSGTSENFASFPGPSAIATSYNFWGGMADAVFAFAQEKERTQDFPCAAVNDEDETAITFPAGVQILALPQPVTLHDANFDYGASYLRQGNSVTVKRHVKFSHAGALCTPAEFGQMQAIVEQMIRDLKSQIIVQMRQTVP